MNIPSIATALWFLAGAAAAACVHRLFLAGRPSDPLQPPEPNWPLLIRPFLWPVRLVAGMIGDRLPGSYCASTRRRLEKADLYPGVDATQWTALCGTLAAVAAAVVAALAALMRLPATALAVCSAAAAWFACERWLQRRRAECERRIVRDLPPCLDLFTVCIEAGATLTAAARFIVDQTPAGPLRNYFDRVLREVRSGRARAQAFVSVADAYGVECLSTLASTLAHAEAAGMSVGQVLRTQAEQRSAERFVRAERQAMQAPVKMLGPLILCIFPCTFIVLAVPIAHRLMEALQS